MKSILVVLCLLAFAQAGCTQRSNSQTTETAAPPVNASPAPDDAKENAKDNAKENAKDNAKDNAEDHAEEAPATETETTRPAAVAGHEQPVSAEAQSFFEKGFEAYKKNHDAQAVEAFEQAVHVEPDFAEAHYRLGLAYAAVGRKDDAKKAYESAVKAYKKLLQREPKSSEAHYHLGLVYDKLYKPEDAVKELKEAVKRQTKDAPEDASKYYELGLAHSKLAQYKEAVAALNKALEIDPDHFRAGEALEKAKAGVERREAFLKQQEKLDKRQQPKSRKPDNTNANANKNSNVKTNANKNANN